MNDITIVIPRVDRSMVVNGSIFGLTELDNIRKVTVLIPRVDESLNLGPKTSVKAIAVAGLPGPQGIQGIKGDIGPQGIQGDTGAAGSSDIALLGNHISNLDPHPAYDDLPSMTLLFENGLI